MKNTAIQPSNTPVITPDQASTFLNTMIAVIQAAQQPDGSNPLVDQIVAATNPQIVRTSARRTRRCKTDSPLKSNGKLKARASDPIRSKEEFKAIADYLLTHGNQRNRQRNYTLYICGVTLGLRVSDILKLTVGDVYDIDHNEPREHVHLITKKNKKPTTDIITPMAAKAIRDLVDEIRCSQNGALDAKWPLFQTQRFSHAGIVTKPLNATQVYRFLREAAEACGVNGHIGTHSMRKTYCLAANKAMAQAGVNANMAMETMQAKLGHRDQITTLRYIGLQQDNLDALGMAVDAALSF